MSDEDRGALGRYVKELREARGLSQVALSEATGGVVGDSHIAAIEKGRRGLSAKRADAIATAVRATSELQGNRGRPA